MGILLQSEFLEVKLDLLSIGFKFVGKRSASADGFKVNRRSAEEGERGTGSALRMLLHRT